MHVILIKVFLLKENLNISLDARDVIYINKINIPPIKIKNNEYENQNIKVNIPVNIAIKIVWIIRIIPIVRGWFINKNVTLFIIRIKKIKICKIFRK